MSSPVLGNDDYAVAQMGFYAARDPANDLRGYIISDVRNASRFRQSSFAEVHFWLAASASAEADCLSQGEVDIKKFNPLGLSVLAGVTGFAMAKVLSTALPQIANHILAPVLNALRPEGELATSLAASVRTEFERSFQPPPMVNFDGF